MKHSSDIVRVLRGLNLVIDQLIANGRHSGPDIRRKVERWQAHTSQIMTTILEYRNGDIKSGPPSDQVPFNRNESVVTHESKPVETQISNTKTPVDHEATPANYVQPELDSSLSKNVEKIKTTKEELDLIGFPKEDSQPIDNASVQEVKEDVFDDKSDPPTRVVMKPRAVPSSQLERVWGFGTLAARMAFGVVSESATRLIDGGASSQSISDRNAERLAEALCRMRGAALKLGQMLSLHDDSSLPPALAKAFERVRQGADYMPTHQLESQMVSQLGPEWRGIFLEFDDVPVAAASIGQVHKGKLLDGTVVAIKVQYPGVANSIESDLQNLKRLVSMTNVMPPGLFIDNIIRVASEELAQECDYIREAESQSKYRELVKADSVLRKHLNVPKVFTDLSTSRILVTEFVPGLSIEKASVLPQSVKNAIARTTLVIAIRELFEWRLVQSDPNYANFLYDDPSRTIHMIDFGATRQYSKKFIDGYMRLVWAAANSDRETLLEMSKELGFLTGDETAEMTNAHVETGLVVGEPFLLDEPYDFEASNLSSRISKYGSTFMKYRLTAPPTETYSLHRKLAGAFLLCIRLKAKIRCRDILEDTFKSYSFDENVEHKK